MAITATKTPPQTVVNKSTRPLILTLSSDLSNEKSFRYLLEVKINNLAVTSLEAAGNQQAVSHFDLQKITESYLSAQVKETTGGFSLHTLQQAISYGPDQLRKMSVVWGEKYLDVNGDVVINQYPADEYWWYQHNGNFNVFTDSYSDPFYHFSLRNSTKDNELGDAQGWFLCTQRTMRTSENAWGVLGCLNVINSTWTSPDPRPAIDKFVYTYYDASGFSLGTSELVGPFAPEDMNTGLVLNNAVIYIPIQYKNVRNFDEAVFDNSAYFTVYGYSAVTLGNQITEIMRVDIDRPCDDRTYYELGFINRYGAWEYLTFTGRNEASIAYDRKEFNKLSSDWNAEVFDTGAIDFASSGGKRAYSVTENVSLRMNTEFMTQAEADQIYHMLQSDYVVIFNKKRNGGFDTEYQYNGRITERKTNIKTVKWDRLIQFEINVAFVSADYN